MTRFFAVFIALPTALVPSAIADPLSGEALYADVVHYAELGGHQTASDGDVATSNWLARELKLAGFDVTPQSWTLRQFRVSECTLKVGDSTVDSYPFWYPHVTAAPVAGTLVAMDGANVDDLRGNIAFLGSTSEITAQVYFEGVNAAAEQAAAAGAVGLVVVVQSGSGDLAAINARAPYHQKPLPIPAVIAALNDEAELASAAESGATASITVHGEDIASATATNVIADLKRGDRWVVVTTPSSGWFTCAGERGPGVALFLGLARWAAASESPFSFRFIANSGHELDNLGAHESLDKYGPPVSDVACWLHLGASISTRAWEKVDGEWTPLDEVDPIGHLVTSEALLPIVQESFADVPWYTPRSDGLVAGELRHFLQAGYNAFGFFGGHLYFHTRHDTPVTTAPEFLEPVGKALVRVFQSLPDAR